MESYMHFAERTGASDGPQTTVMLLDASISMKAPDLLPTRQAAAIEAGCQLIEEKMDRYPNDLVGVVVFNHAAKIVCPLERVGSHGSTQQRALRRLTADSTTNITAGLEAVRCLLQGSVFPATSPADLLGFSLKALGRWLYEEEDKRSEESNVSVPDRLPSQVILLSDGVTTEGPSPLPAAKQLKHPPIAACIQVIGIAGSHGANHLDEPTLKQIASKNPDGSPRYHLITDADSLVAKFREFSSHITRI